MLNVPSFLLCFALLLTSINLSYTKAHGHGPPRMPQPPISSEVSTVDVNCGENGDFNSEEKKCDCKIGFTGENCEDEYTESRRCQVIPSQGHLRQQNCPTGQWCVPDNINCFLYACQKSNNKGWCIPQALNSPSDASATENAQTEQVFEEFEGKEQ